MTGSVGEGLEEEVVTGLVGEGSEEEVVTGLVGEARSSTRPCSASTL